MSVECNAFIGYGFWLTNDEYQEYATRKNKNGEDVSDYCMYVDSYSCNGDVFFGVEIDGTESITPIGSLTVEDVPEEWDECYEEFIRDFPHCKGRESDFYLICHWY